MSSTGPDPRVVRMRTTILIVTIVIGIIIFFVAYSLASAKPQDGLGPNCLYDPRDGSVSCVGGDN